MINHALSQHLGITEASDLNVVSDRDIYVYLYILCPRHLATVVQNRKYEVGKRREEEGGFM
jgi:hypothetical protein